MSDERAADSDWERLPDEWRGRRVKLACPWPGHPFEAGQITELVTFHVRTIDANGEHRHTYHQVTIGLANQSQIATDRAADFTFLDEPSEPDPLPCWEDDGGLP